MIDFSDYTDDELRKVASVQAIPGSISAKAAIEAQAELRRRGLKRAHVAYLSEQPTREVPKVTYTPRYDD